jgi:ParB family chromosome partitioning protein
MTTTTTEKTVEKRKALGRGLDSLLPGAPRVVGGTAAPIFGPGAGPETAGANALDPANPFVRPEAHPAPRQAEGEAVIGIPLDRIEPNPYQTRSHVDPVYLEELAASVRTYGVFQPVLVRPGQDGKYVLIAGECRWKASQLAAKATIPAIVRQVSNQQAAEITIVENLQREDLNCMDEARAFARLSQEFHLTQEQIALRTGCERSTVGNYLRLLKLPAEVQQMLEQGQLGFSHARVLLQLVDPKVVTKVAERAVRKKLSVEQLEDLVGNVNVPIAGTAPRGLGYVDPNVRAAQSELERTLGVRVKIRDRNGKGKIVLEYKTLEDFDRVVEMLKGKRQ